MPDQLVEARFDTSEVLDLAEEALDQVSLAIYLSIDQSSDESFAGRGDTGLCLCGSDLRQESIGVIAAVSDAATAFEAGEQLQCSTQIVGLARRRHESHGQAVLVHDRINLGPQSPARTTNGVIFALSSSHGMLVGPDDRTVDQRH